MKILQSYIIQNKNIFNLWKLFELCDSQINYQPLKQKEVCLEQIMFYYWASSHQILLRYVL